MSWLSHRPLPTALLTVGLFFIALLSGCPQGFQQQQPGTPTNDSNQTDTTTDQNSSGSEVRPIPPPPDDTETSTSTSNGGTTGGSTGGSTDGDTGGSTGGGSAFVTFTKPFASIAVRPPASINVVFNVALDFRAAIASAELVLARDDNADRVPDGAPVFAQAVSVVEGQNTLDFNTQTAVAANILNNQFGRFLIGMRIVTTAGKQALGYATGVVTIDAQAPAATWIGAGPYTGLQDQQDHLVNRDVMWRMLVTTTDNSADTVTILLDKDTIPLSGGEYTLYTGVLPPGTNAIDVPLVVTPAGTYYYYVTVSDGVAADAYALYAPKTGGGFSRLAVTNRVVGRFQLDDLADPNNTASNNGAIFQGFNFNDLAGSTVVSVPDLNNDGASELIIGSRYGKPNIQTFTGQGWGEAYMVYGKPGQRLKGIKALNSVGTSVSGLTFRGIRVPQNTNYTEGLSDIAVVPDMDGDNKPELVFSFPRVESLSLAAPSAVNGTPFQHPELVPDIGGMGNLEYDAINYQSGSWTANKAQFTRGGIVIVSSHNALLTNPTQINRKFARVCDLHEIGQMFSSMSTGNLFRYTRVVYPDDPADGCADCEPQLPSGCVCGAEPDPNDPNSAPACESGCGSCGDLSDNPNETAYTAWIAVGDVSFDNQGPGGFHQTWTGGLEGVYPADPPLANPAFHTPSLPLDTAMCTGCKITNRWYVWSYDTLCPLLQAPLPGTTVPCTDAWIVAPMQLLSAWTGFYGGLGTGTPRSYFLSGTTIPPTSVGARVLGERLDDRFGTAVGSDGLWLYISAPKHTALKTDVPSLAADRSGSGVVYQLLTEARVPGGRNTAQLWVEPGITQSDPNDPNTIANLAYPHVDIEIPERNDYSMPVPHQYIIETIGSIRGAYSVTNWLSPGNECLDESNDPVVPADALYGYLPYGTEHQLSGYIMERTPQIVGPHADASIGWVRALGDVDGDGVRDFAVGSANVKKTVVTPGNPDTVVFTGPVVGSIFIVYGRGADLNGDYLLENLARDPRDPSSLRGVLLQGSSTGENLARVFDSAGDIDNDGYADIIVGSENGNGGTGEAVVVFGSPFLQSPSGGWTVSTLLAQAHSVRFRGEVGGDLTGANVAVAGDVDGDGFSDILIAAPGAESGKGAVYLIYGSDELTGDLSLANIGTVDLPGAKFVGRVAGDMAGGGSKAITGTYPSNPAYSFPAYSRGVAALGDIDGDGKSDYAVSAMLANPNGRQSAGEVYVLYGRGD